jgi:hypothetical protein
MSSLPCKERSYLPSRVLKTRCKHESQHDLAISKSLTLGQSRRVRGCKTRGNCTNADDFQETAPIKLFQSMC